MELPLLLLIKAIPPENFWKTLSSESIFHAKQFKKLFNEKNAKNE